MICKNKVLMVSALLAIGGLAVSSVVARCLAPSGHEFRTHAAWVFKARTLDQLAKEADVIAIVEAGTSTPSRFAYSDNGEDVLPFEFVPLRVLRSLKGAEGSDLLMIERAGGLYPDGTLAEIDVDGGAYAAGEANLVLLKARSDAPGVYYLLNDQARYRIESGALHPVADHDDAVAEKLAGLTTSEATSVIVEALR